MFEEELLNELKKLPINTSKPFMRFPNTYMVNSQGLLGVAVETNCEVEINEKFNRVNLYKTRIIREEASREVILLYTNENELNSFFIKLCCDFLEDSELVANNPIEWYEGWKNILGNRKSEKTIYDVIAELKTLCYLQNNGYNPKLDAVDKGTFDISSKAAFYEVKATTIKTKDLITIHSQFQLDTKSLDRPLYISFCKMEKNDAGDSINSLREELKNNSYDIWEIDKYLLDLGYYEGSLDRDKRFITHELRFYEVDSDFPRIDEKTFTNGKFPKHVVKIEYTISLDGLNYRKII